MGQTDQRLRPAEQIVQARPESVLQQNATSPRGMQLTWRLIGTVFLGLALTWHVITHSVSAYLSQLRPDLALRLNSDRSKALLNLADQGLEQVAAQDAGKREDQSIRSSGTLDPSDEVRSLAQIKAYTQQALVHDPLNARALTILAIIADREGTAKATELFEAAARRSLGESQAVYWLLVQAAAANDHTKAVYYADVLLRHRHLTISMVGPVLTKIAESGAGAAPLHEMLIKNPPWRGAFFYSLTDWITNVRTPLALLLSFKDTATPPTKTELGGYLDFLVRHNFDELAHLAWQQFLSAEQRTKVGFLFNGRFDTPPSGVPFDWTIKTGSGATVEFVTTGADSQRGLHLEFGNGQIEFGGVAQRLVLAPGAYRLKGQYVVNMIGRRGLKWRVACIQKPPLAESEMAIGTTSKPKTFEFAFEVPTDCPAQQIRLDLDARSASERIVSGSITYNNLQIISSKKSAD